MLATSCPVRPEALNTLLLFGETVYGPNNEEKDIPVRGH